MLDGIREPSGVGQVSVTNATKRAARAEPAQRAKRVRVSRACDQCRAGREKCDGAERCQTCESQGRTCTYNEQPKKRGIQPNYIRTLELTLAWIFESFPDSEKRISQMLPYSETRAHRLIGWKDAAPAEALHLAWRNSIVCKQIDQLLSGSDIEVPPCAQDEEAGNMAREDDTDPQTLYQSPPLSAPSDAALFQQGSIRYVNAANSAVPSAQTGGNSRTHTTAPPQAETHGGNLPSATDLLQLPQGSWMLLEHYFTFTQTWLPIIERHDVLKLIYSYPERGLERHEMAAPGHAELWSIMALASLQQGATADFEHCRDTAKSLIPQEHGFQLGHLKSLLILGLADIMLQSWLSAWLVIGTAVRLLVHFNLRKETSTTLFEGRTKHTVLAAFVLDRAISSSTGAITHIRATDIQSVGYLIEDGLEEWSPWQDPRSAGSEAKMPARSMSTFNELVRISLQPTDTAISSDQTAAVPLLATAVVALLRNASASAKRQHPHQALQSVKATENTAFSTYGERSRSSAALGDFPTPFADSSYPFLSFPAESARAVVGDPSSGRTVQVGESVDQSSNNTAAFTRQETSSAAGDPGSARSLPGADIFEELAMLDRTDSTINPDFMQNLGFGPDLDLAEFFGADYQPSDPLLTYMHSAAHSTLDQGSNTSADGVG